GEAAGSAADSMPRTGAARTGLAAGGLLILGGAAAILVARRRAQLERRPVTRRVGDGTRPDGASPAPRTGDRPRRNGFAGALLRLGKRPMGACGGDRCVPAEGGLAGAGSEVRRTLVRGLGRL